MPAMVAGGGHVPGRFCLKLDDETFSRCAGMQVRICATLQHHLTPSGRLADLVRETPGSLVRPCVVITPALIVEIREPNQQQETPMPDSLIAQALQARVDAFHRLSASNTHWPEVAGLRGSAQLALEVAELAGEKGLMEKATSVITMLDGLLQAAEDEDLATQQEHWKGLDALRQLRRDNHRLVQTTIGMELVDPRWRELVKLYQDTFPAFKVPASVRTRISPKNLSSVVRSEVTELLQVHHRDQRIGRREIEGVRAQAIEAMERRTLAYLGKALPGYDFRAGLNEIEKV